MRLLACLALLVPLSAQAGDAGFRELKLSGRGYARGLQHGKALAQEIRAQLAAFEAELARQHKLADPRGFLRGMLERSRFEAAVRRYTPDLHAEVHGIADGAGLPFWRIFALQLIDESWAMGGQLGVHKCSSIGVDRAGGEATLVAQNLDLPRALHGPRILLRIAARKPEPAQLVVTLPGLLGACGLNGGRVGVAVNTLLQLRPRADGLPVAFVLRGLLAQPDFGAARRFLYALPHASGQHYLCGGPELARGFECSARQIRVLPAPAGVCFHTNHPLQNEDWSPAWLAGGKGEDRRKMLPRCPRYQGLSEALAGAAQPGFEAVCGLLRLARGPGGKGAPVSNPQTFAGVVMRLGPRPELWLSAGRPDQRRFEKYQIEP